MYFSELKLNFIIAHDRGTDVEHTNGRSPSPSHRKTGSVKFAAKIKVNSISCAFVRPDNKTLAAGGTTAASVYYPTSRRCKKAMGIKVIMKGTAYYEAGDA